MDNKIDKCPVCDSERTDTASYDCPVCGSAGAFCTLFAGTMSYDIWAGLQSDGRKKLLKGLFDKRRGEGASLHISGDRAVFHSPETGLCLRVRLDNGEQSLREGVREVSVSGLFRVYLMQDGSISSSGDNEYGQRRLDGRQNVISVTAAPRCTYAVTSEGSVISCGASDFEGALEGITEVKKVVCGAKHLALLMQDGSVLHIEQDPDAPLNAQSREWSGVKALAAGAGYTIGLREDGSVLYAGPKDEKQAAAGWTDIVAIAADNLYAVGLTSKGKVLLAGKSANKLIDFGRSAAAEWENVCYIAAGQSVIAAITSEGELLTTSGEASSDNARKFGGAVIDMAKGNTPGLAKTE